MAHHDPGHQVVPTTGAGWLAVVATGVLTLAVGTALAGSPGDFLLFLVALVVFVAPGIGLAGFEFRGAERLLTGAATGYLLGSLLASVAYRVGLFAPGPIAAGSILLFLGTARVARRGPAEDASSAHRPERVGLAAAAALAVILVALPFAKVGADTSVGVAYRAYFGADLMTHLSVVGELQKQAFPPHNPFYRDEPLGYYWLFFLFPAMLGQWIGNQPALLLTYLAGGVMFAMLAFCVLRVVVPRAAGAFLALVVGVCAASFEGIAFVSWAVIRGYGPGAFRNQNLDAFSRWVWELTSLDGLHRSLLYTPQHLFSYTLALILIGLVLRRQLSGTGRSLFVGLLLGGMAGTSVVTAMLAGPWWVGVRLAREGVGRAVLRELGLSGGVALLALGWFGALGFFGETGSALVLRRCDLLEIPAILFVECGILFLLAIPAFAERRLVPVSVLALVALIAILTLDIRGYEGVWMAWRAGSVFLLALWILASVGLRRYRPRARVPLVAVGLLTVVLDVYNAQDVTNRGRSAGAFRWTTMVSRWEMEALKWARDHTPPDAVVQWDVRARDSGEWALIPAIAERRMAVGYPLFLLELGKYAVRERRHVRPIFAATDPERAHRLALAAGIDYLLVGPAELAAWGEAARKFWERPALFRQVFSNERVTIFAVQTS